MAPTDVSWADDSSNPVTGCDDASPGCKLCYARLQARIRAANPDPGIAAAYAGLVQLGPAGELAWTGRVNLHPERLQALYDLPLNRRRLIFMVSMGDLFHPAVPDEFIAQVFAVMCRVSWHTFQVLTKRHGRMRALLHSIKFQRMVGAAIVEQSRADLGRRRAVQNALHKWSTGWTYDSDGTPLPGEWPLPNVWIGVSVEDQQRADLRVPSLLCTPAAVRWVSLEPMIGPVNLQQVSRSIGPDGGWSAIASLGHGDRPRIGVGLDWVVVGGESGVLEPTEKQPTPARPARLEWFRDVKEQCDRAGVPVHMKQLGTVLARELGRPGHGKQLEDFPVDLRVRDYPRQPEAVPA